MALPQKLQNFTFQGLKNKINEILDYLKTQKIEVDNNSLSKTETANGIVIRSKPITSGGGGTVSNTTIYANPLPAIVNNGNDLIGYVVTVYPNGYHDVANTFIATAYIIQGNAQCQSIANGSKVMIYPYNNFMQTLG